MSDAFVWAIYIDWIHCTIAKLLKDERISFTQQWRHNGWSHVAFISTVQLIRSNKAIEPISAENNERYV